MPDIEPNPESTASMDEPADVTASLPATTMAFPQVEDAADEPTEDQPLPPPSIGDVGATFVDWLRGRAQAARSFAATHKWTFALAALCVVAAIAGIAYWNARASRMPSDEQIRVDASSRLAAPSYTQSDYAIDEPLALTGIEVEQKSLSDTRRDACVVDVVATFANAGMETRADARLTYVREGDVWTCSAASMERASHHAVAGVDQQKVVEHVGALLAAADQDEASESLSSLYHNAAVEVTSEEFDEEEQVDTVVLHCASTGTFVRYECDLTAHFRFAPAAGASGLTVTVTEAQLTDNGGASIKGTLSGVAHMHANLAKDADTTDGDLVLQDTAFTGSLSSGEVDLDVIDLLAGNNPKRDDAGLVFTCTTPDVAAGEVTLTLTFGQSNAPDAATATLTSKHAYDDTILLLIPYQREARFTDHFTLEKVG